MKEIPSTALVLGTALALGACRPAPELSPAPPPAPPSATVESRPPFAPPADGRLTTEQVERFVAVKKRARALADGEAPPSASTDLLRSAAAQAAAESRAVRLFGVDAAEYRWVRARVAEVISPAPKGAPSGVAALVEAAARRGGRALAEKTASRAEAAPAPVDDAAREANRKVVEPFRAEIEALDGKDPRPGPLGPSGV